ncbi:MAG: FAD:protein FMN transferase [Planctomycetota bacterium]
MNEGRAVNGSDSTFRAFQAMGTRFECVLGAFAQPVPAADAASIAESLEAIVRDEHRRLSVFDPASLLTEINLRAAAQPISIDPDLFALLDRCLRYADDTGHAFDITAGALMHANGFRDDDHGTPLPVSGGAYRLDRRAMTIAFDAPGVSLDLGGIAKGYVLDLMHAELREHHATSAIIHGGGSSVTAIGLAPDGKPWRARLLCDDPHAPTIDLTDRSLACSSPSGRTVGGCGHIMDTRAGSSAAGADSACVLGPSAEVCEVWSTALVVDPALEDRLPDGYEAFVQTGGVWSHTVAHPSRVPCHEHHAHRKIPLHV